MKFKFCRNCNRETWQSPLRRKSTTSEQEYRCVQCGHPPQTGGGAKNYGQRIVDSNDKIHFTRTV